MIQHRDAETQRAQGIRFEMWDNHYSLTSSNSFYFPAFM